MNDTSTEVASNFVQGVLLFVVLAPACGLRWRTGLIVGPILALPSKRSVARRVSSTQ